MEQQPATNLHHHEDARDQRRQLGFAFRPPMPGAQEHMIPRPGTMVMRRLMSRMDMAVIMVVGMRMRHVGSLTGLRFGISIYFNPPLEGGSKNSSKARIFRGGVNATATLNDRFFKFALPRRRSAGK